MKIITDSGLPQEAATGSGAPARQSGLDVLKCVAALLVVYIHYGGKSNGNDASAIVAQVCNSLERIAVPLFFLITGYYYPRLVERGRMKSHLRKLVVLTLCATLFYFLSKLSLRIHAGQGGPWLTQQFHWKILAGWGLLNFSPAGFHLWYLYAVLYDLLIFLVLDRLKRFRAALPFVAAIYLCGLALNFTPMHIFTRNFLFFGLPCMTVGRLLGEGAGRKFPARLTDRQLWACFLTCNVLVVAELFLNRALFETPLRDFYVFTLPAAVALFVMALRHPAFGAGGPVAAIGCKYSAHIYILHVCAGTCLGPFWHAESLPAQLLRPWIVFALALLLSVGVEAALRRLPPRKDRHDGRRSAGQS